MQGLRISAQEWEDQEDEACQCQNDANGREVEVTWDNHRWVRLRTFMALLERELERVSRALHHQEPGDPSYRDLVARDATAPPGAYRIPLALRDNVLDALDALESLVAQWNRTIEFPIGAPRPEPELRVRPRI
jgi:hypothetical protein